MVFNILPALYTTYGSLCISLSPGRGVLYHIHHPLCYSSKAGPLETSALSADSMSCETTPSFQLNGIGMPPASSGLLTSHTIHVSGSGIAAEKSFRHIRTDISRTHSIGHMKDDQSLFQSLDRSAESAFVAPLLLSTLNNSLLLALFNSLRFA